MTGRLRPFLHAGRRFAGSSGHSIGLVPDFISCTRLRQICLHSLRHTSISLLLEWDFAADGKLSCGTVADDGGRKHMLTCDTIDGGEGGGDTIKPGQLTEII